MAKFKNLTRTHRAVNDTTSTISHEVVVKGQVFCLTQNITILNEEARECKVETIVKNKQTEEVLLNDVEVLVLDSLEVAREMFFQKSGKVATVIVDSLKTTEDPMYGDYFGIATPYREDLEASLDEQAEKLAAWGSEMKALNYELRRFEKDSEIVYIDHAIKIEGVDYLTFFEISRQNNTLTASFLLKGVEDEGVHEFLTTSIKNHAEMAQVMLEIMAHLPCLVITDLTKRGKLGKGDHSELSNEIGKAYFIALALLVMDSNPNPC